MKKKKSLSKCYKHKIKEEAITLKVDNYQKRVTRLIMKILLKKNRRKYLEIALKKWYKNAFLIDNTLKYNPKALENSIQVHEQYIKKN